MRIKLRLLTVVAALALALVLAVPMVGAQGGISWTSGFQVQNLSGSNATITVTFYDQDGNVAGTTNDSIPANGSKTYFPISDVAEGFNGSAVISSDQEIAAIANLLGNGLGYGGSATGFASGSTSVGLPLIMRGNNGFDTWFNVQNTSATEDAEVTVTYTPGDAGTATSETATIPPNASHTFDQAGNGNLGTKFVGSAQVTSDQPVVATVNQVGTGSVKSLLMYDGFTAGSTSVRAPLLMANNSGFYTGISIQNVGNADTTVTVDYSPNTAGSFEPDDVTVNIGAGDSTVILQAGGSWGTNKYVGGATITASEELVVVVNQLMTGAVSFGTAYEGFIDGNLTGNASAPLVMANNSGFSTGIQCQNAGNSAVTLNINYGPNTAGSFTPTDVTANLDPGESVTVLQSGGEWGTNKYVGSAEMSANGNIACIVNELNLSAPGDQFLTYNAINY